MSSQKDPSYIAQFQDNQEMYLAAGPSNPQPRTHEEKMEQLREYFKTKIVNAYNSIYLEDADPSYDSIQHLTEAEKMIRKIILKEKNKLKQKGIKKTTEKLKIRINAKKIMTELMNEQLNMSLPLEELLKEEAKPKREERKQNKHRRKFKLMMLLVNMEVSDTDNPDDFFILNSSKNQPRPVNPNVELQRPVAQESYSRTSIYN